MKYLLCRPLGGLNDSLCQIERGRRMARLSGRKLIVQTETGSPGLNHRFGQAFESVFTIVGNLSGENLSFQQSLKSAQIHPNDFEFLARTPNLSLQEHTRGQKVSRPLKWQELWHRSQILVHEAFGGGLSSASLLPRVLLSKHIEEALQLALTQIPIDSVAIHFRSSDYQTDELLLFEAIKRAGARPVLLASDSGLILEKVRAQFQGMEIISVPEKLSTIWETVKPVERALIELFAISGCKDFIPLRIGQGRPDLPAFSGYTRLAKHIWAVTHVSNFGISSWANSISPVTGIGGYKSKVANTLYLAIIGLPRILWQSISLRGALGQAQRRFLE